MRKTIKKLFIHLEHFLATGFGTGHSPVAPGTIGTAVGVIVFLPILSMPFSLSNRIRDFVVLFRCLDHFSRG